jgi:fibronectin-binding autotransporter adhesin
MALRYWVGGTASWDGTAGTKWSTTDGGAGGSSVPTSADDVFFTAASGASTVTIATGNTGAKSITCTGFTGTLTGTAAITVSGSVTLVAGMTFTHTGTVTFADTGTLTTAGKTFGGVTIATTGITLTLGDALNVGTRTITITRGTFTTNNYTVTADTFTSNNSNTRVINFGSSSVVLGSTTTALDFFTSTGMTFNPGTSTISITSASAIFYGGGRTFATVNFTSTASTTRTISGANTFANLGFNGRSSAGIGDVLFDANQTVTGTFTIAPGAGASARTFYRSSVLGTARTITAGTFASGSAHTDFRDIIAGGASFTGTGFGNCKGNTGITFPAAKTLYWNGSAVASTWSGTSPLYPAWATTSGGAPSFANFPLAQDTAVFTTAPASGNTVTVNADYNIGTIDMSARTSNTMTLTCSQSPEIYGDWINGTGTTLSGTGTLTYAGRSAQTITSAGRTFTQSTVIDTPGGSVTLQDAFVTNRSTTGVLLVNNGTFNANNYNVSLTGASSSFSSSNSNVRTIAIGSGTWTIAGSAGWTTSTSTNLTLTGTGTISMTSSSAKTFTGGGVQTFPTINQGGTGTLTITGSNKFANITNTAIGRVQFTGGTTNEFTAFNLNGTSTAVRLPLGSTNTTQVILEAPNWNVGTGSLNSGNNTGLSFTAGAVNFLDISYVNGVIVVPTSSYSNFFAFF